jgi:hypothetical protein
MKNSNVSYYGINLYSDGTYLFKKYSKKIEYKNIKDVPQEVKEVFLKYGDKYIQIDLNKKRSFDRYQFLIKNRNNVSDIFNYINNLTDKKKIFFDKSKVLSYLENVKKESNDSKYSFYSLGFLYQKKKLETIKLYFKTRTENVDGTFFYDKLYYNCIKKEFDDFLNKSEDIIVKKYLKNEFVNIYIYAIDYYKTYTKYKIYFKTKDRKPIFWNYFKNFIVNETELIITEEQNNYVKKHIEKHGLEEALEGFAYCIDSNKKRSLNLYFNPNGFK